MIVNLLVQFIERNLLAPKLISGLLTSQSSALDQDELPKYGEKKGKFKGKRVARGLYKTAENKLINADINGSLNIIKKVIPDVFNQGIKGLPFNPVMLDPLRTTRLSDF